MPPPWKNSRPGWTGLWATWPKERCPCSLQGHWTRWPLKVPSIPSYSVILWFNYFLIIFIFVLLASITHSVKDVSCSLQDRLQCSEWNFLTRIKSNIFMPGQQGAGRGGWKGDNKVTESSKYGWALLVVAAGTESLCERSSTNAVPRR